MDGGGWEGGSGAGVWVAGVSAALRRAYVAAWVHKIFVRKRAGLQQTSELIFAAIHAKRFDSESDIQVQVRAWIFHFDCFFDSD